MSEISVEAFWERLEQTMKVSGESSMRNFCAKVGLPYQTLLNQRSQGRYPATSMMIELASGLGCSIDWLVFGDEARGRNSGEEYIALERKKDIISRIVMSESSDLLDSLEYIFKDE